jgi:acyl-CoA synthetase (AMP-forming)/AMP-acid ligase II
VSEAHGLRRTEPVLSRLESWASLHPDRVCLERIEFPRDGSIRRLPFTTAALLEGVQRTASLLAGLGVRSGDRVLLCLPASETFLQIFLGLHWLGAAAVPLPSLGGMGGKAQLTERVLAVLADCRPRLVLGDAGTLRALAGEPAALAGHGARLVDADALRQGSAGPVEPVPRHVAADGDTAFIQYTSGSTGQPRGVVVTQGNLRANLRAADLKMQCTQDDRLVTWLPVFHDMGLVGGLLFPLYAGHCAVVMQPMAFLARPLRWLSLISAVRGTISPAPNFAYQLCADKVRDVDLASLDLGSWRLALNGAEPIHAAVLERFAARFAPCGFSPRALYPVYGLAEATLSVAFPEPGEPLRIDKVERAALAAGTARPAVAEGPGVASFVSVGSALPEHEITVVDPGSRAPCDERCVGEITVRGPSISPGYFRLEGPPEAPVTELRTGDLGYFAGGRLYVVDRIKDLVIVAGRNLVPSDVERSAAVSGLRPGRAVAFGVPDPEGGTEGLVVVVEGPAQASPDASALRARIVEAVRDHHGVVPIDVRLVRAGAIPRTSSGKLMRRRARELYLAGDLPPAGAAASDPEPPEGPEVER